MVRIPMLSITGTALLFLFNFVSTDNIDYISATDYCDDVECYSELTIVLLVYPLKFGFNPSSIDLW